MESGAVTAAPNATHRNKEMGLPHFRSCGHIEQNHAESAFTSGIDRLHRPDHPTEATYQSEATHRTEPTQ